MRGRLAFRTAVGRRTAMVGVVTAVAVLGGCGGGGVDGVNAGGRGPAVRIVSGADVTDTVDAALAAPLVVEVVDSAGQPAANALVLFTAPPLAPPAACTGFACQAGVAVYTKANVRTDAQGRASVPVSLGAVAGAARVAVAAPTLGAIDTARYTILPGRGTGVTVAPRDTSVYLGTTTRLRAAVVDRYGNPRPEAPTIVGSAATPTSGLSVTAAAYGVYAVAVQAVGVADTARVRVVPRGTIAALTSTLQGFPDTVVVVDLDGTPRARISTGAVVNGLTWTPDGSRLVFARTEGTGGYRLYATTLTGTPAPLAPTRTATNEQQPAFSHDGRWLFYGESAYGTYTWRLWRANPDGTGAQPVGAPVGNEGVSVLAPSGDGGRVAYARGVCCPTGTVLSVVDVATGAVADYAGDFGLARWSPRDDLIAYATNTGQGLVTPAGAVVRQFAQGYYSGSAGLDWSPDARWLITGSTNSGLVELLDVTSGARIPLPYMAGYHQPSWKP